MYKRQVHNEDSRSLVKQAGLADRRTSAIRSCCVSVVSSRLGVFTVPPARFRHPARRPGKAFPGLNRAENLSFSRRKSAPRTNPPNDRNRAQTAHGDHWSRVFDPPAVTHEIRIPAPGLDQGPNPPAIYQAALALCVSGEPSARGSAGPKNGPSTASVR